MKNWLFSLCLALQLTGLYAQAPVREAGHTDVSKFRQAYDIFATPNSFRTASGAPGPAYYQQQVDYKMELRLDDQQARLYGDQVITYHNNSKDELTYLWVQLDQNRRAKTSQSYLVRSEKLHEEESVNSFARKHVMPEFEGGYTIEAVQDAKGNSLSHTINHTMMRVDLPQGLKSGEQFSFRVKWWYNINNYREIGGRSGYEYFAKDDNRLYVIAQFFPRLCVYNDVEGWQNMQFWGQGEFALEFGNYDVSITVPSDHIVEATGELVNRKAVYSKTQMQRWEKATRSFDQPVLIVTPEEALAAEKTKSTTTKTWRFKAENVRDFAFSSSRKFIMDAMAVKVGSKTPMAISLYPNEGNPLWGEYSTRAVAKTLQVYSDFTFEYPYPKAVSISAEDQGMEYPMICWNYGRPDENGQVSEEVKNGMISVIIHEVGHNFFPMIVNSDERQWTWMDEGMNTFLEHLTELEWDANFPVRFGPAKSVTRYMSGPQNRLEPIMSNSETITQFGLQAYGKPAAGLNILREVIMGREAFDHALKTYANRWKFKQPTPEDFFRTMEDASAIDLDWFWRGWYYTTDYVDIGVKNLRQFQVETVKQREGTTQGTARRPSRQLGPVVVLKEVDPLLKSAAEFNAQQHQILTDYIRTNYPETVGQWRNPNYFYEVTFEKPGGMLMPILVEIEYADGTKEDRKFPVEIWRFNDKEVSRILTVDKPIVKITVDKNALTADIDTSNNVWPRS